MSKVYVVVVERRANLDGYLYEHPLRTYSHRTEAEAFVEAFKSTYNHPGRHEQGKDHPEGFTNMTVYVTDYYGE
jgi:hypothetical protein